MRANESRTENRPKVAFAHSMNELGVRHDLIAHLRAVAEKAAEFGTGLSARELAYYAGLWHDLGEFYPGFQDYLLRSEVNPHARGHGPDHKAAGARIARDGCPPLCLLFQGHHGGLGNQSDFSGWLRGKETGTAVLRGTATRHCPSVALLLQPADSP